MTIKNVIQQLFLTVNSTAVDMKLEAIEPTLNLLEPSEEKERCSQLINALQKLPPEANKLLDEKESLVASRETQGPTLAMRLLQDKKLAGKNLMQFLTVCVNSGVIPTTTIMQLLSETQDILQLYVPTTSLPDEVVKNPEAIPDFLFLLESLLEHETPLADIMRILFERRKIKTSFACRVILFGGHAATLQMLLFLERIVIQHPFSAEELYVHLIHQRIALLLVETQCAIETENSETKQNFILLTWYFKLLNTLLSAGLSVNSVIDDLIRSTHTEHDLSANLLQNKNIWDYLSVLINNSEKVNTQQSGLQGYIYFLQGLVQQRPVSTIKVYAHATALQAKTDYNTVKGLYQTLLHKDPSLIKQLIHQVGFSANHVYTDALLFDIMSLENNTDEVYYFFIARKEGLLNFIKTQRTDKIVDCQNPRTPLGRFIAYNTSYSLLTNAASYLWSKWTPEEKVHDNIIDLSLITKQLVELLLTKHGVNKALLKRIRGNVHEMQLDAPTSALYSPVLSAIANLPMLLKDTVALELMRTHESADDLLELLDYSLVCHELVFQVLNSLLVSDEGFGFFCRESEAITLTYQKIAEQILWRNNGDAFTDLLNSRPGGQASFGMQIAANGFSPAFRIYIKALITFFQFRGRQAVHALLHEKNLKDMSLGLVIAQNQPEEVIQLYLSLLTSFTNNGYARKAIYAEMVRKQGHAQTDIIKAIIERQQPKSFQQLLVFLKLLLSPMTREKNQGIVPANAMNSHFVASPFEMLNYLNQNPELVRHIKNMNNEAASLAFFDFLNTLMAQTGRSTYPTIFNILTANSASQYCIYFSKTSPKVAEKLLALLYNLTPHIHPDDLGLFLMFAPAKETFGQVIAEHKSAALTDCYLVLLEKLADNAASMNTLYIHLTQRIVFRSSFGLLLASQTAESPQLMQRYLALLQKTLEEVPAQDIAYHLLQTSIDTKESLITAIAKHHTAEVISALLDLIVALHASCSHVNDADYVTMFNTCKTAYEANPQKQTLLCTSLIELMGIPALVPHVFTWPNVTAKMISMPHLFAYLDQLQEEAPEGLFYSLVFRQDDLFAYIREHHLERLEECVNPSLGLGKYFMTTPKLTGMTSIWKPARQEIQKILYEMQEEAKADENQSYHALESGNESSRP